MTDEPKTVTMGRRRMLGGLGLPLIAAMTGTVGMVAPHLAAAAVPERSLMLSSRELGERVRTIYYADGRYSGQAFKEIGRIFRDKHNEKQIPIDPDLVEVLWQIRRRLCPRGPLEVVCGYRSPETNAQLRRSSRGVAANSFHMYGKAVDLRIEDCPVRLLHRYAVSLQAGGVGYYPRSNFVHVDTGPLRHWGARGAS